ncbi:MAG TPA: delta-60 repeat domain-containing protein [Flavobacteriales bacterium]|nr:delta-60 repeat domain-containing protein [Flavobacteriales bacterium]
MHILRKTSLFLSLAIVADGLFAQSNSLDLNFNPGDAGFGRSDGMRIANAVNSADVKKGALMADGRMVLVGNFDLHDGGQRGNITRTLQDGSSDPTFAPAAVGVIETVVVRSDGKVIIGGNFATVGGVSRRGIARLNANGSLDTSFDPGLGFQNGSANGTVEHLLLLADGKLLVSGNFNMFNGTTVTRLVRLNTDGTLDGTFNIGTGFGAAINGLAQQPDGKLLITGSFTQFNGTSRPAIARLELTGALDSGFAPTFAGGNSGQTLALRPDGKVWLAGNFTSVNGQPRQKFVLLTASGATDPSFVPAALTYVRVNSLAAQADGKLLVGLYLNNPNGDARDHLARFNADGSIDPVFAGTDFNDNVNQLLLLADQRIVVLGTFLSYGLHGECLYTRLMPDGTVDPAWGQANAFDLTALNIVTQPDGKHVVVGGFLSYFSRTANRVARLNPDGQVDATFNAWWGINSLVRDVVLQPDGKMIIGGHFVDIADATYSGRVMRLNSDGSYDPTFVAAWNQISTTRRLALQADGKVLAMSVGGLNRLLPNGALDPAFTPGLSPGALFDVLSLPDGGILVAGGTNLYNGQTVGAIFRLHNDGSVDTGFSIGTGPNNNSSIQDIERQPDGKILAAGNSFTTFNGQPRSRLVRLNANGSVDLSFNIGTGFDASTSMVKVAPSGKIYVSGTFQNVNGILRPVLARLLPNGTLDASYELGTGPGSEVIGMSITPTEDHVVIGGFRHVNGIGRNRIARIKNTPRVAARILLEGPYNGTNMNDALRTLPSFPLTEPFTSMGYSHPTYTPGATIPASILATTGNFAVVDWVMVEMRPVASPSTVAASRAALLLRNGWVVDLDGMSYVGFAGLAAGNYCVAVRPRNHLPVMSSPTTPVNYGPPTATVDFTLPGALVYDDDARKNLTGVMVLAAGDATFNGTVQYTGTGNDRDPILSRIGGVVATNTVSGYFAEDLNMDGAVMYTGSGNDRDMILQSIGGIVPTNTRAASLP